MAQGDSNAQRYSAIYAVIRAIPRGKVMTYGQVAELASIPRGHRMVATALRNSDPTMKLPWQRVVAKRDRLRARIAIVDDRGAMRQRRLLQKEGVRFERDGSIRLHLFAWIPPDA